MHRFVMALGALALGAAAAHAPAYAQPLALLPSLQNPAPFDRVMRAPPRRAIDDEETTASVPAHLRRQIVSYPTREPAGTIVIDTARTYLYFVLGGGRAIRYGVGVGREGFTWAGVTSVGRKAEWPDWHPPADMIERQPYLPRFMAGGPGNPLGARALYLSHSLYRIHGTNAPQSIGKRVSSGCIRMLNEDVIDLYARAAIGAKVVVLPDERRRLNVREAKSRPPRSGATHLSLGQSLSRLD